MYEFPFDKNFINVLKRHPLDCEETVWRTIIQESDSKVFEHFEANGYPRYKVYGYVKTLRNFTPDKLQKLSVVHESLYYPMREILRKSKSRETFEKAVQLSKSPDCEERDLSIILLSGSPGMAFAKEAQEELVRIVKTEKDPLVISSAIYGLKGLSTWCEELSCNDDSYKHLVPLLEHQSPKVRQAIASTITGLDNEWVFESLLVLSKDIDEEVRNWATFSLVLSLEEEENVEDHSIDRAKLERLGRTFSELLNDQFEEVRLEAIKGLAYLKDQRVIQSIRDELSKAEVRPIILEAAKTIADPTLYPILRKVTPDQTWDIEALEEAIERCASMLKKQQS